MHECKFKCINGALMTMHINSQHLYMLNYVAYTCRFCKKLSVRECELEHNHHVSPEIFAHYPANRRLNKSEEESIIEILQLHPINKRVREMVQKKTSKLVTLKDISNLKMKLKEQTRKGLQEPRLLLCCFHNFTKYDESASTGIVVNEEHILQLCYIQTSHMTDLFEKFPEIVFIDGTYNVNSHGMPLYCLMVEDGYGHGM